MTHIGRTSPTITTRKWVYPWMAYRKNRKNQDEGFLANVAYKLERLGLVRFIESAPTERSIKIANGVLEQLEPGKGKWLILRGEDHALIEDLIQIVPVTYALTHHKSVHPINPRSYDNIVRLTDNADQWAAPFGIAAVLYSSLVVFHKFLTVDNDKHRYAHAIDRLFSAWSDEKRSVIFTVTATGPYNDHTMLHILNKIRRRYGTDVRNLFEKKGEAVILPGGASKRKIPVTKIWED
jgi:hypothetical protein